jgi:hypothetical protein
MESSSPSASGRTDPFDRELIAQEIAHLQKARGVRHAQEQSRGLSRTIMFGALLLLVWLYFMDPVLFAYNRGDAIHAYLYLHNYGSDTKATALAASGYFSPSEKQALDRRIGSFQDYFVGTQAAEKKADALMAYTAGVRALHGDKYEALSPVNKFRYVLFIKTGLTPPVSWEILNPSVTIK